MIETALEKAIETLRGNIRKKGVIAGREFYPDVWGRDAFVSSLGMSLSEDQALIDASELTIDSLSSFQKENGQMPNKISPDGSKVCFGEGGCVDSSLWYPIAVWNHYKATDDENFLKRHAEKTERAVEWAMNLDQNGDFLIETNEGSDWMDLLLRAGRVLYDEALYYAALKFVDEIRKEMDREEKYSLLATKVKENINLFFWPKEDYAEKIAREYGYSGIENDFKTALSKGGKDYYLAEVRFREVDSRCDVYANCLTILFGIADRAKIEKILNNFEREKVCEPYPAKCLWPPIQKDSPDWNLHFRWTDLPHLIEPGNYHNGGIWPYIGGFYVSVLVERDKQTAKNMLEKLSEANLKSDFNEWLDQRGVPRGSRHQSWSAGMYIFTYKTLEKGKSPLVLEE